MRYRAELGDISEYFSGLRGHFAKVYSVRNDVMHGRILTMDQQVYALAFSQELLRSPLMWPVLSRAYRRYTDNPSEFLNRSVTFLDEETTSPVLHNLPLPDFDDTGWLPRTNLEAQLKRRILGRHPIITVQGDGGNGKTALTLQVLHNLVHTGDHPFDAIVWFSAKTSSLGQNGIREIADTITDSAAIVEHLATWEPGEADPGERLLRFLSENKILLVIDNYETIAGGGPL